MIEDLQKAAALLSACGVKKIAINRTPETDGLVEEIALLARSNELSFTRVFDTSVATYQTNGVTIHFI